MTDNKQNYSSNSLFDEIEKETEIESETRIERPFDPNKVKFDTKTLTIDLLIKRLKKKEIDLLPEFQRSPDLWNVKKQSQLIESILMRIPLPVFYFDGRIDNKWQVIDGLQRLSTFKSFLIDKELKLKYLEYLTKFEGLGFDDLPRDMQRRIEETQIQAYIMDEDTPNDVKFNVFKRINTGGLLLQPQEIRNALNQGIPAKFINELAKLREFIKATDNSISPGRMKDRDLITRFVSFYLTPYDKYNPNPDLDSFLNKSMGSINRLSEEERKDLKKKFISAMNLAYKIFNKYAFRKIDKENKQRKPINKALFEVVSVTFAKLGSKEREIIKEKRKIFYKNFIDLNKDEEFIKAITSGTGDKKRVNIRFSKFKELINKVIDND